MSTVTLVVIRNYTKAETYATVYLIAFSRGKYSKSELQNVKTHIHN